MRARGRSAERGGSSASMSSTERDASDFVLEPERARLSRDISASSCASNRSGEVAGVVLPVVGVPGPVVEYDVPRDAVLSELLTLRPLLPLLPLLTLAVSEREVSRGPKVENTDSAAAGERYKC